VVRLQRLQLEHDSGKSLHTSPSCTLIDLNRAGMS
jgi:Asp-tRNA(Asn)/Glu-tRNA(Gln) amidotransferase B subunit